MTPLTPFFRCKKSFEVVTTLMKRLIIIIVNENTGTPQLNMSNTVNITTTNK